MATVNGVASPLEIGVLGAGSWGTALAVALARNGHQVRLWGRNATRLSSIGEAACNTRYLPGVEFPESLVVEPDVAVLAQCCDNYLVVVPSHAFRTTLEALFSARVRRTAPATLVWGTKGLEAGSGAMLGDVVAAVAPGSTSRAALSGPTFASEVGRGLPTAVCVASDLDAVAKDVATWFHSNKLRVYTSTDLAGVQLGGAIKNVMAIATGIADGLGLGANARAAVITRGLAELRRLGAALGGQPETFMGLTGVGDLILTCTDDQSRNRRVGLGLGLGRALEDVLSDIGQEAEGINTARELFRKSATLGMEMPITEQVYKVLFEAQAPRDAVAALLQREPRAE